MHAVSRVLYDKGMPRKDKGFARLKHENIELNTFHGSESDDDDNMRVIDGPSGCAYCGTSESTRSRWNIVMTITMLGLLCSSVFLFMYFAYRDSQMTGRLNKLEDTIERLTSGSNDDQPSVTDLAAQLDAMAEQLNTTTTILSQSVQQVNTECHDSINKQNDFVNSKASLLDGALKQVNKVQVSVNKTRELLATVRATVVGYVETKAELDKSLGKMKHDLEKSHENMEKMRSDMATHQAELKNLEGAVHNHTGLLTNTSLYCHRHVDQLHLLLTDMNISMATEMSKMWNKMTQNNLASVNTTSKPLDIIGHLMADPVFMTNISLKIASMINESVSHDTESVMESPVVLQIANNVTKLQEEVGLLREGLQQINHTLQTVKANLNNQIHISNITTSTAVPSSVATMAPVNTTPVSPNVITSSSVNSTVAMTSSASETLQSTLTMTTTFSISVSNSLGQAVTTAVEVHSSIVETSSSPIIISPSPSYSEEGSLEEINSPSLIILSTGEMPSSVELLSTSVAVTSPIVIDNETTELMNDINGLETLLQLFDKMDVDKLRLNETGLQKIMFDKIDKNHDSTLTVDEVKDLMANLEEKLNALETNSHMVTLSSGVQLVSTMTAVETTSQPVVSSQVDISLSTTVISSSADISSSPVAAQSTLLKASPSSIGDLIEDLEDFAAHYQ